MSFGRGRAGRADRRTALSQLDGVRRRESVDASRRGTVRRLRGRVGWRIRMGDVSCGLNGGTSGLMVTSGR
jgi:hypothetical protein